jgi:hypothetical protein
MKTIVIGGGITGRMVKLVDPTATIYDWGQRPTGDRGLTRAFGANYLWEPLEGFECAEVEVVTHVDGTPATPASVLAYKRKVFKESDGGDWGLQFKERTVGYELLAFPDVDIVYETRVKYIDAERHVVGLQATNGPVREEEYDRLVSTIPLFALLPMTHLGLDNVDFSYSPIYVKVSARPPDAPFPPSVMYVNYLSSPDVPAYRFCDRGGERHYEGLTTMGVLPTKKLVPGKIRPLPETKRRQIVDYLGEFGIRCFGRYGTWRPDELVHDTWKEIRQRCQR